jgi:protein AroM
VSKRVAFVTIGQSPRDDIMPDIRAEPRSAFSARECGALDGLDAGTIAALAPDPGEERLVSRLADGTEVILGKEKIQRRLEAIFTRLDPEGFDLIVLLCTGHFRPFVVKTPFLEPQLVVDHFVLGMSYGARTLGILVPDAKQIDEFHGIDGRETRVSFASPYETGPYETGGVDRFELAGRELASTDLIVMHCMGYSSAMRQRVARASGRPVMLSRQLVAHALDLLLQ